VVAGAPSDMNRRRTPLLTVLHLIRSPVRIPATGFVASLVSTTAVAGADETAYNHFEATDDASAVFTIRGDGQVRFRK